MRLTSLVMLCALAFANGALAQSARKDSGGNAQLMQQMQQLAAERTSLQAENARMKKELDETRKERDSLKGEREAGDRKLHSAEGAAKHAADERKALEDDLAKQKEQMTVLVGKFRETVASLREVETGRTTSQQLVDTRTRELKSCVDDNVALYKLNDEILDKFESQGFWNSVARAEPFTRLKRVELENLADQYRGRAEDAKLPPSAATAPLAPPGS
jgi:chromosome segregation ATPase